VNYLVTIIRTSVNPPIDAEEHVVQAADATNAVLATLGWNATTLNDGDTIVVTPTDTVDHPGYNLLREALID
jgi:hypothetical protein